MNPIAIKNNRHWRQLRRVAGLMALFAALAAPGVLADVDAHYALDVAGIKLSDARRIAIVREDLEISFSKVRVRYRLRNLDARSKTATIGFPLPHPGLLNEQEAGAGPEGVARLLRSSTIKVNARRVRPVGKTVQIFAVRRGEGMTNGDAALTMDITGIVRKAGLDPEAQNGQLLAGLEAGAAHEKILAALPEPFQAGFPYSLRGWLFSYWRQKFGPNETVTVEHVYRPEPGHFLYTSFDLRDTKGNLLDPHEQIAEVAGRLNEARQRLRDDLEEAYRGTVAIRCSIEEKQVDGILERHIAALSAQLPRHVPGAKDKPVRQSFSFMSHILETTRSWHGPVGNFSLTINGEGRPVLFCFPGPIELIDKERFIYRAQLFDFVPKADLDLTRLD